MEKQLKKLNRRELLEILITQTRRTEELERQLEEANKRLRDRTITIEKAGSLAEAAMQLNGVFEAAQSASEQYLINAQRIEQQSREEALRIVQKAKEEAQRIIEAAWCGELNE